MLCNKCQYCGDKNSFLLPNNMLDMDKDNPSIKPHYCCMGDSKHYAQRIDRLNITKCECFEEL